METVDQLQTFLQSATRWNVRGRLLDRGEARAIVRRNGQLPLDAPEFGDSLDTDLSEYGLSVLRASLALREQQGENAIWRNGFLFAGRAFESLVRNGSPRDSERGVWRVMGGASYHLAGYSAMAFSLLNQRHEDSNFAPGELALVWLLLRNLKELREVAQEWLLDSVHQDDVIRDGLESGEMDPEDAISVVLTTTIFRSFAAFEFALSTGIDSLQEQAKSILRMGLGVAQEYGAISLWWIIRIALNVIDDLWKSSLGQVVPGTGPEDAEQYPLLREFFLASLYARDLAELELWPSQLEAAQRATSLEDDLVVSLPTSAGKTRIAEICTLVTLSKGQRVLILTPLRALSAQTEKSFRQTFGPLGFSVSSMYGACGTLPGDEDVLRNSTIIVATPEKLDFALRNDPALIDDVGLIVLDEGHLIGQDERELRFEVLIQRLLLRKDADQRRIVCLSAILPEGEQLENLTAWIRQDVEGTPVQSNWRPTRQRFGTLTWTRQSGRLTFDTSEGGPFIHRFVELQDPIAPRRKPFPKDNSELTLAAAWKFASEGRRTLVYCTQRNYVESYAKKIVDLSNRGYLRTLLNKRSEIDRAVEIGNEWLGVEHPAVQCLRVGVAIHHAMLPNPFLREVESLLKEGILTVTVASPTIAQGLNLGASVLLIPNLFRARVPLSGEEFANVAGRAGRAFADLEGLIIHVMYEPDSRRRNRWRALVNASKARSLESGIIQITAAILKRLAKDGVLDRSDAFEYLANHGSAWVTDVVEEDDEPMGQLLEKLDTALLGLIDALDADLEDLPQLIDEGLNGSLWARQIGLRVQHDREQQLKLLRSRSELIWNSTTSQQRSGFFAMGVGLESGLKLDAKIDELEVQIDRADMAALSGELGELCDATKNLGILLLSQPPFAPKKELPIGWADILSMWLAGKSVDEIGAENIKFIEETFAYRLVWALEAVRMYRIARGWKPEFIAGGAAACVESGLPRFTMTLLVRSGLSSRVAALYAVVDSGADFVDGQGLLQWLQSSEVVARSGNGTWPTSETASVWTQFYREISLGNFSKWTKNSWRRNVDSETFTITPIPNQPYRVELDTDDNSVWVCTTDFQRVVRLRRKMIDVKPSIIQASFEEGSSQVILTRLGESRPRWSNDQL